MLRNSLIALVVFLVLAFVFVLSENKIAPSFQSCISQESGEKAAQDAKDKNLGIVEIIESQTICSLRLIDRHNGFFAALAAVAVAAFTFTLWIATYQQAQLTGHSVAIAAKSAAAFMNAERPHILIESVTIEGLRKVHRIASDRGDMAQCKIQYTFKNFGSHPGFVQKLAMERFIGAQFPPSYEFQNVRDLSFVTAPGESLIIHDDLLTTLDVRESILRREHNLYIYGFVEYVDIFENPHKTEFFYQHMLNRIEGGRDVFSPTVPGAGWTYT